VGRRVNNADRGNSQCLPDLLKIQPQRSCRDLRFPYCRFARSRIPGGLTLYRCPRIQYQQHSRRKFAYSLQPILAQRRGIAGVTLGSLPTQMVFQALVPQALPFGVDIWRAVLRSRALVSRGVYEPAIVKLLTTLSTYLAIISSTDAMDALPRVLPQGDDQIFTLKGEA
jgi:hypothetical protein